jgi:hypothetical protein
LVQGTLTPLLDTPIDGYYNCGRLSENGTSDGPRWFIGIARGKHVIWQNIDIAPELGTADETCTRLLKKGILRPIDAPVIQGSIGRAAPAQRN